jgi:hypothetical protein
VTLNNYILIQDHSYFVLKLRENYIDINIKDGNKARQLSVRLRKGFYLLRMTPYSPLSTELSGEHDASIFRVEK